MPISRQIDTMVESRMFIITMSGLWLVFGLRVAFDLDRQLWLNDLQLK